jgi:hypothetical protein
MEFIEPQYTDNIIFNANMGGYPVANIIKQYNINHEMIGGSNKIGLSRFDGFVVPLGLPVFESMNVGECSQMSKIKTITSDVIDDNLFDKLFNSVRHRTKGKNTRRNMDYKNTRTRKGKSHK